MKKESNVLQDIAAWGFLIAVFSGVVLAQISAVYWIFEITFGMTGSIVAGVVISATYLAGMGFWVYFGRDDIVSPTDPDDGEGAEVEETSDVTHTAEIIPFQPRRRPSAEVRQRKAA